MISLVCFDLGRVLVRICDGWQHACQIAGVPVPQQLLSDQQWKRLSVAVNRLEVGVGDVMGFCREAAEIVGLTPQQVESFWDAYHLGIFPGTIELIEELRAAKVRTACLSNTNERHWQILMDPGEVYCEALSRLDHRFASHLIAARKPDPATYAFVERETGIKGDSIVFFDDVPENVAAAMDRGWRANLVPRCENPIPGMREVLRKLGVFGQG